MTFRDTLVKAHDVAVFRRRIQVLATHLSEMIPPECTSLLDVGCGDGSIDSLILSAHPGMDIRGIDVFVRNKTLIPVEVFDGKHIPLADASCDVMMMVDVLHHTDDPNILLAEARRVARRGVLIKDHTRESWIGGKILSLMDWVGNRGHGVRLPYNYWSMAQWQEAWSRLGLKTANIRTRLKLYPSLARPLFETNLHFIAYLTV
jgi:SAM-dependent methyltransferase